MEVGDFEKRQEFAVWVSRSCDKSPLYIPVASNITRLDALQFRLWGYIKSRAYRCRHTTLAKLKASIRWHVLSISTDMLFNDVQSIIYRLQAARQSTSNQDNYIFIEHCPELSPYEYLQAIYKQVGDQNISFSSTG
ncbi:hypothetical protein LAZ67_23001118 [Cordylochernes scorpioides]|uniref:Uncharacterized protein n=1 Tax=Cordylochernes scorpioides TaxID=51811 RepID=A0ABY6LQV1_9ARAC|nr:hypothetical protein LAZ67_23001118 [Cordylochernes scorpioides]